MSGGSTQSDAWWRNAVGYQIYPRSFADSDADGNGDLGGIIEHLDHLEHLGIDLVWLSPVYPSPGADNGYDVSDYRDIDPMYGSIDDLDALVAEIHARGMRIVVDLVANHTSDEHPWFIESRDPGGPKRDWYWWRQGDDGPPNNWQSRFSGPAWTLDPASGEYYLHLFAKQQPDLNWENPEVRAAIHDVMRWWLDRGVDGFRMDVINFISKHPDLPDVPGVPAGETASAERFYACGPRLHEFLREMRAAISVGRDEPPLLIGETPAATIDDAVLLTGRDRGEADMLFQFEHMDVDHHGRNRWDERPFELPLLKQSLARWQNGLAEDGWNSLYLNNHDQPRVVSRWGNDGQYWRESAKLFATVLHMHRGTPFVYQGEEIGMTNASFESLADVRDVQSLRYAAEAEARGVDPSLTFSLVQRRSRDNARTPMQWASGPGAGFTSGEPWIDVGPSAEEVDVAAQLSDPDSVLSHYRELIALRHRDPLVVHGVFELLEPDHPKLWAFTRRLGSDALLVLANASNDPLTLPRDLITPWPSATVVLSSHNRSAPVTTLSPWESLVIRTPNTSH